VPAKVDEHAQLHAPGAPLAEPRPLQRAADEQAPQVG
jgi:hypothetical protein